MKRLSRSPAYVPPPTGFRSPLAARVPGAGRRAGRDRRPRGTGAWPWRPANRRTTSSARSPSARRSTQVALSRLPVLGAAVPRLRREPHDRAGPRVGRHEVVGPARSADGDQPEVVDERAAQGVERFPLRFTHPGRELPQRPDDRRAGRPAGAPHLVDQQQVADGPQPVPAQRRFARLDPAGFAVAAGRPARLAQHGGQAAGRDRRAAAAAPTSSPSPCR